jgi:acyl carrier protein
MNYHDTVITTAKSLGMLDSDGQLVRLDSLMIIDLVLALEDAAGVQIPVASLREDVFGSVDSVAQMLSDLPGAGVSATAANAG